MLKTASLDLILTYKGGHEGGGEALNNRKLRRRNDLILESLIINKNIMSISDSGPGFIKADFKRFQENIENMCFNLLGILK